MQKASKSGREKVGLTTVEVFLQMCCLSTSIFERPRLFLCLQHAPITKPIYTQNSEEPENGVTMRPAYVTGADSDGFVATRLPQHHDAPWIYAWLSVLPRLTR